MSTIPSTEPNTVVAGTTIKWTRYLEDYKPEDGWVLKYNFISSCGSQVQATSTDNGDSKHLITINATDSEAFIAEHYSYVLVAERGSPLERYALAKGSVNVISDYSTTVKDPRSYNRRMLDAIRSLLEGSATADVASYSIANRSLTKFSRAELEEQEQKYFRRVKKEEQDAMRAAGKRINNTIQVRF